MIHIFYRNYNKSINELSKLQESNNWFNLPKYIMACVLIKQN